MISDVNIRGTLTDLDRLYNLYSAQANYYSKLAMLEYCGWLELTMDEMISNCATVKLGLPKNRTFIANKIIPNTYGFHYEKHFGHMLRSLVGLTEVDRIEQKFAATGQMQRLETHLNDYASRRNGLAHTHIAGVTKIYDAPSVVLGHLGVYFPILQLVETEIA